MSLTSFGKISAGSSIVFGFKLIRSSSGSYSPTLSITSYYDSGTTNPIDTISSISLN